jgi:uncharacterized protein (TIGR03118 family)
MLCFLKYAKFSLFALAAFALPNLTPAQSSTESPSSKVAERGHYIQTNLLADPTESVGKAPVHDPNLLNPWGLTRSPNGSPWWVGNNDSGTSTLYAIVPPPAGSPSGTPPTVSPANIFAADPHPDSNGNGINSPFNNFVMVPPPGFAPGTQSAPSGVVFNGSPTDFLLNKGTPAGLPALFMFATEDGTISGWNPGANVAAGAKPPSVNAVLEVDNSDKGSKNSAVYKGMTSGEIDGKKVLYVTNFRSARVEVYDTNFRPVHLRRDAFDDNTIPRDFAPFNIQNIGGSIFVTYAKQDAARHDPLSGDGFGFVDIYSTEGELQGRLEHGDFFNAPWGVVWTPRDFGEFSNTILVGNFRSGWIAAFNGFTKKFIGFVRNPDDSLVTIGGLWSLTFGNNGSAGPSETLFFTAGGADELHGLFGTLTPVPAELGDGDEE